MLSILIAVYNTERWLPQCLDSLKAQTTAIEVIAVDDASTDGSWDILSRYAAEDKRFKAIRLEKNSGQAYARNIALKQATGEWITMLDSDDWIGDLSEIPEIGSRKPENPDIQKTEKDSGIDCIILQCDYVYPDGSMRRFPLSRREWTPEQAVCESIGWKGIHGLYIVRADIHKRYPYDEAAMLYSDDNTTRLHFLHSRRIVACDVPYYYRQHSESSTQRLSIKMFDIITAHTSLQRMLEKEPKATPEMLQRLRNLRWRELTDLWHYFFVNRTIFSPQKRIIKPILRSLYDEMIEQPVTDPIRFHFGYWKIRPYSIFCLHLKTYFRLRQLLGKE